MDEPQTTDPQPEATYKGPVDVNPFQMSYNFSDGVTKDFRPNLVKVADAPAVGPGGVPHPSALPKAVEEAPVGDEGAEQPVELPVEPDPEPAESSEGSTSEEEPPPPVLPPVAKQRKTLVDSSHDE